MSLLALRRHLLRASRHLLGRLVLFAPMLALMLSFLQSDRIHSHPGGDHNHNHNHNHDHGMVLTADALPGAWCYVNHDLPGGDTTDTKSHAHDAGSMTSMLPATNFLRIAASLPDTSPPPFTHLPRPSTVSVPLQRPPIA